MRHLIAALLALFPLAAADELRIAREAKALADFERVQRAVQPNLADANTCIQSQASLLPVTVPADLSTIHYRKGYCTLAGAAVSGDAPGFAAAAADFDKAIQNWPARIAAAKKGPPELVPSGLRVLVAIATLRAGGDEATQDKARYALLAAQSSPQCTTALMDAGFCDAVLRTGRQWLGWIEIQRGEIYNAVRDLAAAAPSGWTPWATGRKAFQEDDFASAAKHYRLAVEAWEARRNAPVITLLERLGPADGLIAGYVDLGGALLVSGDAKGAVESLSRALKQEPSNARALFLRARARELAGQPAEALADYNLASRAAFAASQDLASGEAHLYRGILLYHRKDYSRAEDEFASALNFEIPRAFRGDASAWRHMAAVAAGSCGVARFSLEYALANVSPYFPKEEARARSAGCSASSSLAAPSKPAN